MNLPYPLFCRDSCSRAGGGDGGAVRTVKDYLTEHPDCSVRQVIFNVFKDEDKRIFDKILKGAGN